MSPKRLQTIRDIPLDLVGRRSVSPVTDRRQERVWEALSTAGGLSSVPMGTRHKEVGVLRLAPRGYELHVDGGGVWALDVSWRARKLLGRRVIVKGVRSGFDRLDVMHITVEDGDVPLRQRWLCILG